MTILLVGLDYRQTPLVLRERLYLGGDALRQTLTTLHGEALSELIIISTCNRLELYAVTDDVDGAVEAILRMLVEQAQRPVMQIQNHVQILCDGDAVRHLMRVASGLESLVVGETEILGQITSALRTAYHAHTTGPILSRLFHDALHTGKRARSETAISKHTLSVSHAAVRMARQRLGDLSQARVLVIGAGRMAELALWALQAQGVQAVQIINRGDEKASALAARFGFVSVPWTTLEMALAQADVVIAATSAPQPILKASMLTQSGHDQVLIDVCVPRNIDENVRLHPHVCLYDLDDLHMVVEDHRARRQGEVMCVERIISQEVTVYQQWLNIRCAIPAIRALREQTETMAADELARALRRMPDLTAHEQQVMGQLVHRLVNKFLHVPTTALREQSAHSDEVHIQQIMTQLLAFMPHEVKHDT